MNLLLNVLAWIWSQLPGFFFGAMVIGIVGQPLSKRAEYLRRCLVYPRSWGRMLHGFFPCPMCLGSQHPEDAIAGGGICLFCLADALDSDINAPAGYITGRRLRRGWDWRLWCANPGYPYRYARTRPLVKNQ